MPSNTSPTSDSSTASLVSTSHHTTIMAEPQPDNVQEGADAPDVLPASKEDRKAAAALSSLDANPSEDVKPKKEADLKALNEAMKNLDMTAAKPKTASSTVAKKDEAPKKLVKVDAADVAMLVRIWIYARDMFGE